LLNQGYSLRAIARTLGRSVSTVSDELKRNTVGITYLPAKAQHKAYVRRKDSRYQGKKIVANLPLQQFIDRSLLAWQSPQAIAGRLKAGLEPELPYVSRDTIETYIRSVHGRRLEYQLKLLKAGQKRHGRHKRIQPDGSIGDPKVYIDNRPGCITNRERVGDLEVDFIVSGKSGYGYCLTAADRRLRVGFIRKVLPVTAFSALKALEDIQQIFPELQSISTDNDLLWRYHKQLEVHLGVPFYFCHAYHSWEKGSVENFNGVARKYIPKGSDISQYNDRFLAMVETKLNSRYMAVLGYQTPHEALHTYRIQNNTPG
jgi:IS30 family transposase